MYYEAYREITENIGIFLNEQKITSQLSHINHLWLLCAINDYDEVIGISAFSYIDGRTNAEFEYIYIAEDSQGYGEGKSLLLESFLRLNKAGVKNIRAYVTPDDIEKESDFRRFLVSVGFGAISLGGTYITCPVSEIKKSQIVAEINEHPEYFDGVHLLGESDDTSKSIRLNMWDEGILRIENEGEDIGLSRYYGCDEKPEGVLIARRNGKTRVEIEDFYDSIGDCRLSIFRRLLLCQIKCLIDVFPAINSLGINCQSEEIARFIRRCFGKVEHEEKLQIWEVKFV